MRSFQICFQFRALIKRAGATGKQHARVLRTRTVTRSNRSMTLASSTKARTATTGRKSASGICASVPLIRTTTGLQTGGSALVCAIDGVLHISRCERLPTSYSDELGDPCCEWNFGTAPRLGGAHAGSVTSPAHASSVPLDRTSCSSRRGLVEPQVAAVWRSADGGVALAWASEGPQCVCEFLVNLTVGSQAPAVYTVRATPGATISGQPQALRLCGAAGQAAVVASVAAVNRAGVSPWSAPAVLPAGAPSSNDSASAALARADGAGGCGLGVLQSGSAINSAGSTLRAYVPVSWQRSWWSQCHSMNTPFQPPAPLVLQMSTLGLAPAVSLWAVLALLALTLLCLARDPLSALRRRVGVQSVSLSGPYSYSRYSLPPHWHPLLAASSRTRRAAAYVLARLAGLLQSSLPCGRTSGSGPHGTSPRAAAATASASSRVWAASLPAA